MIVSFLSDYGTRDEFVGVCHAVIAGIAPEARVVDVGHGVPRHDVLAGAALLHATLPYLPAGVCLAVVDPEVGTERRGVAVRAADGRHFVGPDNGLLWPALERAGGAVEAADLARSPLRLEPVAATFHGRDVFAPVAAHLASGTPVAETGDPLAPDELVALELPGPRPGPDGVTVTVLGVDGYGNVQLSATHEQLAGTPLRLGAALLVGGRRARMARTFADTRPGELLLYEDGWRRLALAVNRGDAAAELGLAPGDELTISAAR